MPRLAVSELADLYEQVPDSVAVYGLGGEIRYLNRTTRQLFGVEGREVRGERLWALLPDAVDHPFHRAFQQVAATGEAAHFDHCYAPFGRWYEHDLYRVGDAIWVFARDVTEARRTRRRVGLLADAARAFASAGASVEAACAAIAVRLADELGDCCVMRGISDDRRTLVLLGAHDRDPAELARLRQIAPQPVDDGLSGEVVRSRAPLRVDGRGVVRARGAGAPAPHREHAEALRIGPLMIAPLVVGDEVLGALSVHRRGPGAPPYDDADLELLCEVADCVALALAQARGRERAERARRELEEITDALPTLVAFIDRDERYQFVSRAYEDWFGRPREAYLGRAVREMAGAAAYALIEPHVRQALGGAMTSFEADVPYPTGTRRVRAVYVPRWRGEVVDGFVALVFDLTEVARLDASLAAAERSLRERDAQFQILTETMPQLVWTAGPDGMLDYVNARWTEVTGMTLAQLRGDGWRRALHADDAPAVAATWARCVAEGAPYQLEHRLRNVRTGEGHWYLTRALPVHDGDGRIVRWLGTSTDIDVQRRAAESLREADRRKDEFLAMLGHELRNPLAPIVTALDLVRLRGGEDRFGRELDVMGRQVKHLLELVDDLLDVSRITRGEVQLRRERLDLAVAVADAIEMASPLLEQRGHALTVDVAHGLELHADRARIAQVISNLLTNAAKYTDPGGKIGITAARDGDEIVLRVADTGRGIAPELLPRIFDPFVQGKRTADRALGGLGLGLAIVRSMVELHGGVVEVASAVGEGSVFAVRLPARARRGRTVTDPVLRRVPLAAGGQRILVVDDNVDAAVLLADVLTSRGHLVQVAHDGPTALEVAVRFLPEVGLLDLGLPVMDGYELARRLRELPELASVRLIAISGYGQEEDRRASESAGFEAHVVKPIDIGALIQLLGDRRS